ncbi:MAG TPA: hypothetical protein ENN58_01725, partial [bacterium]|nr:hypothetical protein [bacterium]
MNKSKFNELFVHFFGNKVLHEEIPMPFGILPFKKEEALKKIKKEQTFKNFVFFLDKETDFEKKYIEKNLLVAFYELKSS